MKKFLLIILAILMIGLTACGSTTTNTYPSDELLIDYDGFEPPRMSFPSEWPCLEEKLAVVIVNEPLTNAICYNYITLNSALAAMNDPTLIAGFNKEDMVGTLIYKLYPELDALPSIVKNGVPDIEAAKKTRTEYVVITENCGAMEYHDVVDMFANANIQTYVSSSHGENTSTGTNTCNFFCLNTDNIYRFDVFMTYIRSDVYDMQDKIKNIPINDLRSVLFLGDTMNSVYTRECVKEMMEFCGGINVAENIEISDGYLTGMGFMAATNTETTADQIAQWNPDVIWVPYFADYTAEDVLNNPAFAEITAVKNGEVYTFPGELEPWYYPTPAFNIGRMWAMYTLYPEVCPYENVLEMANRYYKLMYDTSFTTEEMGLVTLFNEQEMTK